MVAGAACFVLMAVPFVLPSVANSVTTAAAAAAGSGDGVTVSEEVGAATLWKADK
jgi:hypothetical protein